MKRVLSFLLAAMMIFSHVGGEKESSHEEELLIAARRVDIDAMSAHAALPEASSAVPFAQEKHYASEIGEEKKSVLVSLYSMLQYTMGEESEVENGTKTVSISLKLPDFSRIKALVHTELVVSGKSATQIISDMVENGSIAKNYMIEKDISVKLIERDGEFFVSCNERDNASLFEALALLDMLRFFAAN